MYVRYQQARHPGSDMCDQNPEKYQQFLVANGRHSVFFEFKLEGKLVAVVPGEDADRALGALRGHESGRAAAVIGRVVEDHPGVVAVTTGLGAERIVDMPIGEQLPRIC